MRSRLVLTEENFRLYEGEYDAVTHAPYQLGDVLCRCTHCGRLVREDLLTGGRCPLCGEPFRAARLRRHRSVRIPSAADRRAEGRRWKCLACLLALLAPLPVLIWKEGAAAAFPWLGSGWLTLGVLIVSAVCAAVTVTDRDLAPLWERRKQALLLAFLPLLVPCGFWLAVWLLVQVLLLMLELLKVLVVIAVCVAVISALFGS